MAERFLDKAYSVKTDAETQEFYDRWAAVYDEELSEKGYAQPRRCAQAMAGLMDDKSAAVLDVGCGTGLSGIALAEAGFSAIDGCDFSQGMLDKAGRAGIYRRLFAANLNDPPLDADDGHYGGVACVGIFSFGHVQADALDDILRVLKPGGALVIGLNDHFYQEGSLTAKLDALSAAGLLVDRTDEHGAHIPGAELTGWIVTGRKG